MVSDWHGEPPRARVPWFRKRVARSGGEGRGTDAVTYKVAWLDGPGGPEGIEDVELAMIGATIARLGEDSSPGELLADADAILCDASPIGADLLDQAPRVQIISEYGIGYDNIDVGAASQRGIWVSNVPGFCAAEVADHAVAMILAANRRLVPLDRSVRAGRWDGIGVAGDVQRLGSQTVGLVGFGAIGRGVARRLAGFGARVLAWSPHLTEDLARSHGVERAAFDDILSRSDYLSLHVPAGSATRGMIDTRALGRMKPGAWLINTARGSLVDEDALLESLRSGRLGGAALDVRRHEGPDSSDPFWALENVLLTPHHAYYSRQSLVELRRRAARNVAAVLSGGAPNDPVNPNVVPRHARLAAESGDNWLQ